MLPFRLVLVRPQFAGNLGACARVASNFNLTDMVLVSSFCSIHDSEAKRYATNEARDFLDRFKSVEHLSSGLSDCHVAIGFTCRDGLLRKPTVELGEVAALASGSRKVALVFGNEKVGLDAEELSRCTQVCHIPTADIHESLNLSHAVAVVVARIFDDYKKLSEPLVSSEDGAKPVTIEEFESLMSGWAEALGQQEDPQRLLLRLKRFLGKSQITHNELELFRSVLERVQK